MFQETIFRYKNIVFILGLIIGIPAFAQTKVTVVNDKHTVVTQSLNQRVYIKAVTEAPFSSGRYFMTVSDELGRVQHVKTKSRPETSASGRFMFCFKHEPELFDTNYKIWFYDETSGNIQLISSIDADDRVFSDTYHRDKDQFMVVVQAKQSQLFCEKIIDILVLDQPGFSFLLSCNY